MNRLRDPSPQRDRRQSGLTLVELMVALALSLLLMAGVGTMFQANKRSFMMQDSFSRLQENGRFALNAIVRDLRGAGYLGCSSGRPSVIASTKNDSNPACDVTDAAERLFGTHCYTEIVPDRYPMVSFPVQGVEGSSGAPDQLAIRFSDGGGARVTAHSAPNQPLTLTNQAGLAVGDMAVVSDCEHAAVFEIAGIASGNVVTPDFTTSEPDLGKRFISAEVSKFTAHSYEVKTGTSGIANSLYRAVDDGPSMEFIEGIDDLVVTYGLDTDNDGLPNEPYRRADEVGVNWPSVVSIRVSLTAVSLRNFEENNGQPLEQDFTATVALRNRLQ